MSTVGTGGARAHASAVRDLLVDLSHLLLEWSREGVVDICGADSGHIR